MRKVKYKEIGERIRQSRINAGLKQKDCLAPLGDITPQMLSDWEKGYVCPSIIYLKKIAYFFNISLDYLILGKNEKPARTEIRSAKDIAIRIVELVNSEYFVMNEETHLNASRTETIYTFVLKANNRLIIEFKREYEKLLALSGTLRKELFDQALADLIEKYDLPLDD